MGDLDDSFKPVQVPNRQGQAMDLEVRNQCSLGQKSVNVPLLFPVGSNIGVLRLILNSMLCGVIDVKSFKCVFKWRI